MKILALETSDTAGSVAALDDDMVLAEIQLDRGRRSATTLAPTAARLLQQVGWTSRDVELVAVASGPGSFTGLRIGVTTAKAFAYAVDCPIVGVNTLEAVAFGVSGPHTRVWAVLEAQRQQVFAGHFERLAAGSLSWLGTTEVMDDDVWLAGLLDYDVVSGPALRRLAARLPPGVIATDPATWAPTATAVGQLGRQQFLRGVRDDPFSLVPNYFRRTAAEEQWERRTAT
jgi:tRNA threonylcarbamoyladenosine biosynthesis protein TsaB